MKGKAMRFMTETEMEFCFGPEWRTITGTNINSSMIEYFFKTGLTLDDTKLSIFNSYPGSDKFTLGSYTYNRKWVIPEEVPRITKNNLLPFYKKISGKKIVKKDSEHYFCTIHFSFDSYHNNVVVYKTPTSNCQLGSLCAIQNFLQYKPTTIDIIVFLLTCFDSISKKILIFDVNDKYFSALLPLVEKNESFPYVSSNSSKMVTGIIRESKVMNLFSDFFFQERSLFLKNDKQKREELKFFINNFKIV